MALDMRQGSTGQTKWPIGTVILLGAAGIAVAALVMKNRSDNAPVDPTTASSTPPAGVATFATHPAPSPGRAGAAAKAGRTGAGNTVAASAATSPLTAAVIGPDGKPLPAGQLNGSASSSSSSSSGVVTPPAEPVNVTIYDSTSKDVMPPTLMTPIVYSPLPTGVRRESLAGTIQVVINQAGVVDSVKSTMMPKSVGETAFITWALSIAKTWRYEPAIRESLAVRYQVVVPVTVFIREGGGDKR